MSQALERCPPVRRRLVGTRFDTTFLLPDQSERLCFGIPGGLCEDCHQLYIDPELIELLDLGQGRCVFAIESDPGRPGAGLVRRRLKSLLFGSIVAIRAPPAPARSSARPAGEPAPRSTG